MSWTAAIVVPVHNAVLNRIDGGSASGPAEIVIYDAGDVELVRLPLAVPGGAVDGTTGALTLAPGAPQSAVASGVASHADLVDNAGVLLYDGLAVESGTDPVAARIVLANTNILQGAEVTMLSGVVA